MKKKVSKTPVKSASSFTEDKDNTVDLQSIMHLLQWNDSTLPVGAFAFSNGLESALQTGVVTDADSLQRFTETVVRQTARMDGVAFLHAHRAATANDYSGILAADAALWQQRVGEEQQLMLARMGKKLAELATHINPTSLMSQWLDDIKQENTPGCFAVGHAVLLAGLGVDEARAFASQQYGIASMILGAAVRLMRIDHYDTQRILAAVNEHVSEDYQTIQALPLTEMTMFAPMFDVLVGHHVGTHVRLFMN